MNGCTDYRLFSSPPDFSTPYERIPNGTPKFALAAEAAAPVMAGALARRIAHQVAPSGRPKSPEARGRCPWADAYERVFEQPEPRQTGSAPMPALCSRWLRCRAGRFVFPWVEWEETAKVHCRPADFAEMEPMTEQPAGVGHEPRPGSRFTQVMQGTISYRFKGATRTALVAVAIAIGVAPFFASAQAGSDAPSEGTDIADYEASYIELQRQVNELRSDLLDERERRIGQQMEANGATLVVLGILIGVAGLWFCSRFRAIASSARVGTAVALHHVQAPRGLLTGPGAALEPSRDEYQPLTLPVSGGLDANSITTASANGNARTNLAAVSKPRPPGNSSTIGEAARGTNEVELQRLEEVIADCTEAIRLTPDNSRLYLERAIARSSLDRYEEALADYDRAIQFAPDNAAAYLGRCGVKSELGRHEEAISDYDQALHLDPDATSAFRDP